MKKKIKISTNENTTMSNAINDFIGNCKVRGLSVDTINDYETGCNLFMAIVGNKAIDDIDSHDLEKYIVSMRQRNNSNNTINTRLRIVKAFMKYLDIDFELPYLKRETNIKQPYTEEEIKILLKKPTRDSFVQWRNLTIISTLLATGMRCRTLCNLKISDLDFTNNTIFLEVTKTKKKYYLPMSSSLKQSIKYYLSLYDHENDDYLFVTLYGEQMARPTMKQTVRDYCLARGVQKTSIHLFRHSFAIQYLKNGGNIMFLKEILGHSDLSTTQRYLHVDSEMLQENFDNLCPLDASKRKGIKIKK